MKRHAILPWFLMCVALVSCGPARKLARDHRRAERHLVKAMVLDPSILSKNLIGYDTITVHDTLVVPGYWIEDTMVLVEHDTLYLDSGRLHVRVITLPGQRILVRGECEADTVWRVFEVPVQVPCPPVVAFHQEESWIIPYWCWLLLAVLILIMLWYAFSHLPTWKGIKRNE